MNRYLATPLSIINALFDLVEAMLGVRFVLKLFGANPTNVIVRFLYRTTDPLVEPFRNIFRDAASNGLLIEWSTLIAMLAYGFLAVIFARILYFFLYESEPRATHRHV